VLDLVGEDARSLDKDLGLADHRKLEEYLEAVRSIEKQIQAAEKDDARTSPRWRLRRHPHRFPDLSAPHDGPPGRRLPDGHDPDLHLRDGERGLEPNVPWIEVRDGHHSLSHHGGNVDKTDKIQKIDQFYVEQFSYFVQKMKSVPEGDARCSTTRCSSTAARSATANRHNHNDLPILLAGKAQGTVTTGRHVRYEREPRFATSSSRCWTGSASRRRASATARAVSTA